MKFAQEIFPKGTFPGQKSDGAYINETLASGLDVYAKKIAHDMHFLLLVTGNDSVGNGKSTLATHQGSYLTWKINKLHKVNNTFTARNIVFKATDLVKRSFELPPYSVIVLDEGDDLTNHAMKATTMELKRYFRKCRQLNQILILILPSFFELPKFFALSRSHCLSNVKFLGEFDRGFFDFYGPNKKKLLYLKGKKEWDYNAVRADFSDRFFGSYCFFPDVEKETQAYKDQKYADMLEDSEEREQEGKAAIIKRTKIELFQLLRRNLPEITQKRLAEAFGVSERTATRWYTLHIEDSLEESDIDKEKATEYNNNTMDNGLKDVRLTE